MSDNVILLGNSLNLLEAPGKSWEEIVSECERAFGEIDPEIKQTVESIPLVFRMSRFFNKWQSNTASENADSENTKDNEKEGKEAFNRLCRRISKFPPTEMHVKLRNLIKEWDIITTNYDYAIESSMRIDCSSWKAFEGEFRDLMHRREFAVLNNLTRCHERVWHIHGEANEPESIVIDNDGYSKALAALKLHGLNKCTWLSKFMESNVHILGLELRPDEKLLWHAFQMRLENSSKNTVYYYHFVCENDKGEFPVSYLKELLISYKVSYIPVKVKKDGGALNFHKAWEDALIELEKRMYPTQETKLVNADFPPFQSSYPAFNIVTSTSPTVANSARCWMNIGVDKLNRCAADAQWIFDTNVEDVRNVFYANVKDIISAFKEGGLNTIENGTHRYSFYIEYSEGRLYKSISSEEPLLQLNRISNGHDYAKYKKSVPKQNRHEQPNESV